MNFSIIFSICSTREQAELDSKAERKAIGSSNMPASEETEQYILFTDARGPYQIFSPLHTGVFSDGSLFYPNLLAYYYVNMIFSKGNIVDTISMNLAHKFILKQKCQEQLCDLYNINNYITDYSNMSDIILEIENRNKVILLRQALEIKFENDSNLQALLMANPSQVVRFVFTDKEDDIIGIGKDSKGKNMTGKILDELRTHYFEVRIGIVENMEIS